MLFINKNYEKLLLIWLLLSISLIFLMIIVGGLTRLTNSGLSITQWELFTGIFPPLNEQGWINYFNLYKKIPQFEILNSDMTMNEFKVIFYWEYFHRLLGRFIGIFFLIPLIYFSIKKTLNKKLLIKFYFVFLLIVFQGIIGWYMVESGLINNTSVSHYRLSLHLIMAFLIISILYWSYLNILNTKDKLFFNFKNKLLNFLFFLILTQIVFGAFVSGLDAGMIYQTWPKMNMSYLPDDIEFRRLEIISIFNEQSIVQLIHRCMAYFIFFIVLFLGVKMYLIEKQLYLRSYLILLFVILSQIFLGIFTLISGLNVYLASMHQITSIILVFVVLNLNHKFS